MYPRIPWLVETFGEYPGWEPYDDFDAMTDAVDYWLDHPDEREAERQRIATIVRAEHTYLVRAQTVLDVMGFTDACPEPVEPTWLPAWREAPHPCRGTGVSGINDREMPWGAASARVGFGRTVMSDGAPKVVLTIDTLSSRCITFWGEADFEALMRNGLAFIGKAPDGLILADLNDLRAMNQAPDGNQAP